MQYIIGFILFFISIIFSFFIPGSLLLSLLRLPTITTLNKHILSWLTGIAVFLLLSYGFAYLQNPQLVKIILGIFVALWIILFIKQKKQFPNFFKNIDFISVTIIFLGSVAFASLMFFSGFQTQKGLQFFATNGVDGIRHIAYIADQTKHFPPQEPSVAGEPLQGFHYFYDFLLSRFALFYGFLASDLYFRYFPIFISLLYGGSFLLLFSFLKTNKLTQRLGLFLLYLCRSSVFFVSFFYKSVSFTDDALVQPLGLIINPFTVLSIAFLIAGIALLPELKKSWKYGIIIGLLLGILSQIKVYSGIIGIVCVLVYALYLLIRYRLQYIVPSLVAIGVTGVLTVITFFPNNIGEGGLIWAPFLFYSHYLETDLFAPLQWANRLLVYIHYNNFLGIVGLYTFAVGIFIIFNFGLRLLVFTKTKKLFTKSFWQQDLFVLLLTACFTAFLLPTFFIQSISVFDTIQFFWILLVLLCIPTAYVIADFCKKLPKLFTYIIILLICITLFPGTRATINKYVFASDRKIISPEDVNTLQHINKTIPKSAFLILIPEMNVSPSLPQGTPFIAALTRRQVYYEEGWLPTKNENQYAARAQQMVELQKDLTNCFSGDATQIVRKIGSPYIVTIGKYPCLASMFPIEQQVSNPQGLIFFYKIKE